METPASQQSYTAFNWAHPDEHCLFLEEKIDVDLGYYFTKKYIATAFWSQISMPINLALTFITALTTAQANTTGMLSDNVYSMISVAALILSVLNTFFRPHVQMSKNAELMREYSKIGSEFEAVYYGDANTIESIDAYKSIQKRISELRDKEGLDTINFITDFIHLCARSCCFRSRQKWLDTNRTIMAQCRDRSGATRCMTGGTACCTSAAAVPVFPPR